MLKQGGEQLSTPETTHDNNNDLEKWLKHNTYWNKKRTKAVSNIFSIPKDLICDTIKNENLSVKKVNILSLG